MQRTGAAVRRWVFSALLAAATWAHPAVAADVRFVGSVGYSHILTLVLLNAQQISNYSPTPSGALRMELWATPAPFGGSTAGGYLLTSYGVPSLAGGASMTSVNSGSLV